MSKHIHGFTIIEVVLVLAIAGLIFLMVFVALPALQRSQRDTQRRNDMSRLAAALTQYQTNNNGLPAESGAASSDHTIITNYLGGSDNFKDPNGAPYTVRFKNLQASGFGTTGNASDAPGISIYEYAYCNSGQARYTSSSNFFAILYKLEGSGTVCIDNQ